MNNSRSIKQNILPDALPDFRNFKVNLRILLISYGLAFLQAMLQSSTWSSVPLHMLHIVALLTPTLWGCLLLLWTLQPWLSKLAYLNGVLTVNALAATLTLSVYYFGGELYRPLGHGELYFDAFRYTLLSVLVCCTLLMHFRWHNQVLWLALNEARSQILRARIRPHFLFNTLNAVLSIVRAQPKQAEAALQDMADLFRVAMSDANDIVPLRQEIKLSKQYIELEKLRMGEHLCVNWQIHDVPDDVLVPPLLLQPLLENAVYHGIESLPHGGCINIDLEHSGNKLQIKIENPCAPRPAAPRSGNKMALQNIRERLVLLFGAEAHYDVENSIDFYRVKITLPYIKERRYETR